MGIQQQLYGVLYLVFALALGVGYVIYRRGHVTSKEVLAGILFIVCVGAIFLYFGTIPAGLDNAIDYRRVRDAN